MISYHELMFFQGDDPNTQELEPVSLIKVNDKTRWIVPWNATYVYVSIPEGSSNVDITNIEYDGMAFVPGRYNLPDGTMPPQYSLVTEGGSAGSYKWYLSDEASRHTTVAALYNSSGLTEISDNGTGMTNIDEWDFSQDSMKLAGGISSANYTSKVEHLGHDIVSVNVSLNTTSNQDNITFLISENDGENWTEVELGTRLDLPAIASDMRFMIQMSQDIGLNNTPEINDFSMVIEYVPDNIDLWLETKYDIDVPADGIEFSIHLTYDMPDMPIYYVGYFDEDIQFGFSGFEATQTTFESLPGKVVYMTMGEEHGDHLSFSVRMPASGELSMSASVIIVILFVVLTMGIVGFYLRKYTSSGSQDKIEKDDKSSISEDDDEASGSSAKDITEEKPDITDIIRRKKILEQTIARLDNEVSSGLIGTSAAERMKASYHEELDEINSQLEENDDDDASSADKSADNIPEAVSAELEDLSSQKSEAINKLKDLDQRLENGEVSDEEHAILKASYKKQAIDIMKKMDSIE